MPIYDFCCKSCGYITELMRKASDASVTVCPKCAQESFEKMLSAPSFQLNGTGWYATDFKGKKPQTTKAETDATPAAPGCAPGCGCH